MILPLAKAGGLGFGLQMRENTPRFVVGGIGSDMVLAETGPSWPWVHIAVVLLANLARVCVDVRVPISKQFNKRSIGTVWAYLYCKATRVKTPELTFPLKRMTN